MDIILRLVIITVLMLMVIGVIVRPNPWRWTICFTGTALGISGFVLDNAVTDILTSKSWFTNVAIFAAKTTVISVWLLVQCIFDERFRFDRFRLSVALLWIAVVIMDMWRFKMGIDSPLDYTSLIFALILMGHGEIGNGALLSADAFKLEAFSLEFFSVDVDSGFMG